jgi:hypothetical protein
MKSWVLVAGLLAAVAAPPALAADMDDGSPYPRGGVYDEPRYPPRAPPQRYDDDDEDDGPDTRNNYSRVPAPNKYAHVPPYQGKCVRSEDVRERLTSQGWRDFHAGQPVNDSIVTMRARRPNGRLFELTLHRCSGQVVDARPLEPRPNYYTYRAPAEQYGEWNRRPDGQYGRYAPPWFERPYAANRWPPRWFREDD